MSNNNTIRGLGLGIDTGGTYTDAAVLSLDDSRIITKAKALTTRNDLAVGIGNAMRALDPSLFPNIKLLALSSTLATNSVVEGKGCRVGLIVIGHSAAENIPVDELATVAGGHDLRGERKKPLDLEAIKEFVLRTRGKVDAYAISAYLSVRNPEHEVAAKQAVQALTSHPVICGHELSTALGFHERSITAVLNARLLPVIADLIASLKKVQAELGIKAPLMIVKGDGSLMDDSVARERPVETILSGPAASLIGAKVLAHVEDGVMVDVGGTTTDIGILRDGRPRLDPEGALLGGWKTRVKAVDVFTSGIGGDSRIVVNGSRMALTSLRVIPLCIAVIAFPTIREKLQAIQASEQKWLPGYMEIDVAPQVTEFFTFCKNVTGDDISEENRRVLELVRQEPRSVYELADLLHAHPLSLSLKKLEDLGAILRIGLTPTDILHAEGSYVEYDAEASKLGVDIQSRYLETSVPEFIALVKKSVIEKIAKEILRKLIYDETGILELDAVSRSLIASFITGAENKDYSAGLNLNKPIIGIGAPVNAYLPKVAEALHTKLLLPEHSEVGNAVGAISGNVMESIEILIKPKKGSTVQENPPCTVHAPTGKVDFETLEEALVYSKELGRKLVTERAGAAGASSIEIIIDDRRTAAKLEKGWGTDVLIDLTLSITAVGKPRLYDEEDA